MTKAQKNILLTLLQDISYAFEEHEENYLDDEGDGFWRAWSAMHKVLDDMETEEDEPIKYFVGLEKCNYISVAEATDILSIGMRLAYMHDKDLIDVDTTLDGETGLTHFAIDLASKFHGDNWDEYIETAIEKEYGRNKP